MPRRLGLRLEIPQRFSSSTKCCANSTGTGFGEAYLLVFCEPVPVRICWVCETCGASGEIETELPEVNLQTLTVEGAALTMLDAVRTVKHPHPVTPRFPALC